MNLKKRTILKSFAVKGSEQLRQKQVDHIDGASVKQIKDLKSSGLIGNNACETKWENVAEVDREKLQATMQV
jgi:hypothetical protein